MNLRTFFSSSSSNPLTRKKSFNKNAQNKKEKRRRCQVRIDSRQLTNICVSPPQKFIISFSACNFFCFSSHVFFSRYWRYDGLCIVISFWVHYKTLKAVVNGERETWCHQSETWINQFLWLLTEKHLVNNCCVFTPQLAYG